MENPAFFLAFFVSGAIIIFQGFRVLSSKKLFERYKAGNSNYPGPSGKKFSDEMYKAFGGVGTVGFGLVLIVFAFWTFF